MKITQIMLGKGFGGAERSYVDTTLALASRGHNVQAICHRKFVKQEILEEAEGVQLYKVNVGGELDFTASQKIAKHIRQFRPEIVHTHLKRAAWHGGRGAYLAGVPVVSKLHNYVRLKRYRYVHTLIGTTEDQRRHAVDLDWPEDRVVVIPNFSRLPPAKHARQPNRSPLRLLSYGRYVHKKGFDVLLRVFKELLDRGVDAELKIGGSGPEQDRLFELAQKLGIADKVSLGVWIDDVSKELDQSDVFVLSSRDEPFGIVMLEAMARGLPIVSTRTQGPLEVLSDDLAWLVDIGSVESLTGALLRLVENPEDARKKAAHALENYRETYHEDAVLPKLEALYRSVSESMAG